MLLNLREGGQVFLTNEECIRCWTSIPNWILVRRVQIKFYFYRRFVRCHLLDKIEWIVDGFYFIIGRISFRDVCVRPTLNTKKAIIENCLRCVINELIRILF